jgi:hypothetical protein
MVLAGWAVACSHLLRLGVAIALWIVLEMKIRLEEGWLSALYPEYSAYRERVRKRLSSPQEADSLRSRNATLEKGGRGEHRKYRPFGDAAAGGVSIKSPFT